jgi:hypothetical protein
VPRSNRGDEAGLSVVRVPTHQARATSAAPASTFLAPRPISSAHRGRGGPGKSVKAEGRIPGQPVAKRNQLHGLSRGRPAACSSTETTVFIAQSSAAMIASMRTPAGSEAANRSTPTTAPIASSQAIARPAVRRSSRVTANPATSTAASSARTATIDKGFCTA